jgi:hypothetical protein
METLRWWYYELKRLERLVRPEQSVKLFINVVGSFWLWRHGAKREMKIYLWPGSRGWYAPDFVFPHLMKAIEADDPTHKKRYTQDVARDHELKLKGWRVIRVTQDEMENHPARTRRRVRAFIKRG